MVKIKLYPSKIEEPNANKSSGLSKYCFKAVESKNHILTVRCDYQHDPKYYHPWTNLNELLKGGMAQCGRRSSYGCSHETYYGITGYRNTCPIAGVVGTFTQPAKLRLHFSPKTKGIGVNDKINSVEISFQHRRVGVDVATDRIYENWGPNFCGYNTYPNRKVLKVSFAGQTKEYNQNPPLSKTEYSTVTFKFNNITFNDLNNGYIDIQYGNNLSTNPGNIYIKGLSINVDYTPGKPYLDGKMSSYTINTSNEAGCRGKIHFKLEAGYQQNGKKIPVKNAPKALNNKINIKCPSGVKIVEGTRVVNSDKKTLEFDIIDNSNIVGKKKIIATIVGENIKKEFSFETKRINKPNISFPSQIEHNTKPSVFPSIIDNTGCTTKITVYSGDSNGTPLKTFENVNINGISSSDAADFYRIVSNLDCGEHTLFFKMGDGSLKSHLIYILPTHYEFKILYNNSEVSSLELIQNKNQNTECQLIYEKRQDTFTDPVFKIINPTYGLEENGVPTPEKISEDWILWDTSVTPQKDIKIGTYSAGDYSILIQEDNTCKESDKILRVKILSNHTQNFDSIFVRGEDSTSFDYEYLVALEGDSITKPIFVETIELGASYDDIKICANKINITGLSKMGLAPISITNTSERDIENLYLELNTLIRDGNEYQISTKEWFDESGIFKDFKENFDTYNQIYKDIVSIKNLTPDSDSIDEENVYIHINKIESGGKINLQIPFKNTIEKEVYVQILLFEEPLRLYEMGSGCPNEEDISTHFSLMEFQVYDSIVTEMSITGDLDIIETQGGECPLECFYTENGITYTIKNIDTSNLGGNAQTIISNDPRLIPYEIKYKNEIFPIDMESPNSNANNLTTFTILNGNKIRSFLLRNVKVNCTINFPDIENQNFITQNYSSYTNADGEAIFYVTIPEYINEIYTTNTFNQNTSFNIEEKYIRNIKSFKIDIINNNFIEYRGGDTVPLKVKCYGNENYLQNEIIFNADINKAGQEDSLTVYYKICNLPNNEGILKTSFETNKDDYKISYNKIEEDIYLGVETKLCLETRLEKMVVEQNTINRLFINLHNKTRPNKEILIEIEEENINKYNYLDCEVELGRTILEDNKIIWIIDSLEKNTITKGYFDFKANTVGKSLINIKTNDFLHNEENIQEFGEDSYKCECRKNSY